jgi:NAD(P)-dependent dehydrogenase (short-subunit alcohol dehydrogenase family)
VCYPAREICPQCWSLELIWSDMPDGGELIAESTLRSSFNSYFQQRMPWRIGSIKLDAGPVVLAHVHGDVPSTVTGTAPNAVPNSGLGLASAPARVRMIARTDKSGQGVLFALPEKETPNMMDDRQLRTLTCDPKSRRVLITDGSSATGQALVKALVAAGASEVLVGIAAGAKPQPGEDQLKTLPGVKRVPLDLADARSVAELAGEMGDTVDILINTATFFRPGDALDHQGTVRAQEEMEINYFGLLRLVQAFAPAMRLRGADEAGGACAWVNLFSVYALSNWSAYGTSSASQAAAYSLSQNLRADLAGSGVKVINVLSGPLDDAWNQSLPPPKVSPSQLASAVVNALQQGIENVTLGPVAEDLVQRFREDPMVLERELISRSLA